MSGGTWEYVMGYTTGSTTEYGSSEFTEETFPGIDSKYVDIYVSTGSTQYSKRILGDATGEMGPFNRSKGSWYSDSAYFVPSSDPWFGRGGSHSSTSYAGLASFGRNTGTRGFGYSFRVVLQ